MQRKPCSFFSRGECKSGDSCRFAHDSSSKNLVPIDISRKACSFFSRGECKSGDSCRFAHIPTANANPIPPVPDISRKACTFFSRGECKSGDSCRFAHDVPAANTNVACPFFSTAAGCRFGNQCRFLHSEIQKSSLPALVTSNTSMEPSTAVDKDMSIQVIGATSVVFGPGACIRSVSTSTASCCRVAINGLSGIIPSAYLQGAVAAFGQLQRFARPHDTYAIATFGDRAAAERCVAELNGRPLDAKPLNVIILAEPGDSSPPQACSIRLAWIVPTTRSSIADGVGPSPQHLLKDLTGYVPGSLVEISRQGPRRKAIAQFASAGDASQAVKQLSSTKTSMFLTAEQIVSAKFTIPNGAFTVLKERLHGLLDGVQSVTHPGPVATVIKIRATVPRTVYELKRTVDRLIKGETFVETVGGVRCVPVWSPIFDAHWFAAEAAVISAATGAFILADGRRRELRLVGEGPAIDHTKAALRALLAEFHAVPLTGDALRRVKRGYVLPLHSVLLPARRLLLVRGAAAKVHVASLLEAAGAAADNVEANASTGALTDCPICFCAPELPVRLQQCGHTYCQSCFHSWLGQGCFPIACMAAACGQPVPMAELQARLGDGLLPLLRQALYAYVAEHSETWRHCITPDCPQVYATDGQRRCFCTSCGVWICTRCHVDDHEGLTCVEFAKSKAPANALRNHIIEEILTLKCPRCAQAFVDFEGCFALSCCKCPCQFCGWCLADCQEDAHQHVRSCTEKPPGADVYFGTREQFVESQRKRQHRLLKAYLAGLNAEERVAAVRAVETDLKDLGIVVEELIPAKKAIRSGMRKTLKEILTKPWRP